MWLNAITMTIALLGVITVVLSFEAAWIFFRVKTIRHAQKVSNAIGWQLIGEAVIGAGTLLFSMGAHFGWLTDWSMMTQSLIRFTMFAATSATTFHLVRVVKELRDLASVSKEFHRD